MSNTEEVICMPPAGEGLLRTKLANWERYLHEEHDADPLIRMAVGYYRFESIHPFTGGNGRTGRRTQERSEQTFDRRCVLGSG